MITYYTGQYQTIAVIYKRAIHELAKEHYSPEQLNAWSSPEINYEYWNWRCKLKRPFVYYDRETICGFIEFDPDGHIDCHYVLPEYSRQGIGGALLRHVLEIAAGMRLARVYVEASHLAKGLYLKHGFSVVRPNQVERNGVTLDNWIMERPSELVPEAVNSRLA